MKLVVSWCQTVRQKCEATIEIKPADEEAIRDVVAEAEGQDLMFEDVAKMLPEPYTRTEPKRYKTTTGGVCDLLQASIKLI